MDLDLRKLRYFAAVAEHEHFGRAAASLFIAQPVLSRQIRALEHELGCALLVRTTRSVALTDAGRQLLEDAPAVLAAADAVTRRVHAAARGSGRLVVGFAPGLRVSPAVSAYAAVHPEVEVEMSSLSRFEQEEAVRDGRVDVGFLRGRYPGLRTVEVGSEPIVACMPSGHRLARRRSITTADLAGELMLDVEARKVSSMEEKLELVATGRGLVVLGRDVARSYARDGIVLRRVTDAPPNALCVAVSPSRRSKHVQDFVAVAVSELTR